MQEMMEQAKKNVANGSATEPATVPAAPPHVMTMQEMMEAAKKKVAPKKVAQKKVAKKKPVARKPAPKPQKAKLVVSAFATQRSNAGARELLMFELVRARAAVKAALQEIGRAHV